MPGQLIVALLIACYLAGAATPIIYAVAVARRNGVPLRAGGFLFVVLFFVFLTVVVTQIDAANQRAERALAALDEARTRVDMCHKLVEQCCR